MLQATEVAREAAQVHCLGEKGGKVLEPILPVLLSPEPAELPDNTSVPPPSAAHVRALGLLLALLLIEQPGSLQLAVASALRTAAPLSKLHNEGLHLKQAGPCWAEPPPDSLLCFLPAGSSSCALGV